MDRLTATRVFVEVIDSGSQTAAAERLDMSRAMVSRYLAELEEWVGARLLHRSTRRLSLTDAGAELLPQCREMLAVADAMQATGQTRRDSPRGTLRITSSLSFAQAWLTRAAAAFVERYPGTAIDLQVNSQVVNLVEERIDLALRIANQLDPNLIARRLGECRSVICAAPDYLRRHGTPRRPEDLALHNCLTPLLLRPQSLAVRARRRADQRAGGWQSQRQRIHRAAGGRRRRCRDQPAAAVLGSPADP